MAKKSTKSKALVVYKPKKKSKNYTPFLKKAKGNHSGDAPESKYYGMEILTVAQHAGSIIQPTLNNVIVGTGPAERIGREITLQSVHIKGFMHLRTFNYVPAQHYIRFILYIDTECQGNQPTPSDIIANAAVAAQPMNGFYNLDEIQRFVILKDMLIKPVSTGGFYNSLLNQNVPSEFYTPFEINCSNLNFPISYTGTGATLADVRNNNIGVLAFSSDPASNVGELQYQTRIRYKDN